MTARKPVRSTAHDFGFMDGRCSRCGLGRSEAGELKCTGRYRLTTAEVDGSIQRRMREIARGEGREVEEPGNGTPNGVMPMPYKEPSAELERMTRQVADWVLAGAGMFF